MLLAQCIVNEVNNNCTHRTFKNYIVLFFLILFDILRRLNHTNIEFADVKKGIKEHYKW